MIVAVCAAQAEFLREPAAALLDHRIERGAVAIAVERMDAVRAKPRPVPRARRACRPSCCSTSGLTIDSVARHVPIEHDVAGARERQRPALRVADISACASAAAGEGVLHDREADQHHDQHEPADQRRRDEIIRRAAR